MLSERNSVYFPKVRINGDVEELSEAEIAEYYQNEPTFARLRSQLAQCGEPIDWADMKQRHEELLQRHKAGESVLHQTDSL